MQVTKDQLAKIGACQEGLDLFEKHYPDGIWDVTPESCQMLSGVFPFDWLAERLLSPKAKIRYLRVLAVQREWYLVEREKVIDRCRENGGIADDDMKSVMAGIERTYSETTAAAFSAACAIEEPEKTDAV